MPKKQILECFPDDVQDVQSRIIIAHQLRASADIQDKQTKQDTGWADTSDRATLMRRAADAIEALSSRQAAGEAEAMARALKAAHEALSRANVTAYLDMPEDTADVVARAVIAALLLPKAGEMETETAFEIWEDDLMVASASTEAEGLHYFAVYSQDGPVKLVRAETVRQVITTPSTEGRKREDQA